MKTFSSNWNADDYARHSSAQLKWARELIAKLDLQGHETLLDIGCGNGQVTAEMAALLPNSNATGIDSSSQMITLAEVTYPHHIFTNLVFILMDATRMNFTGKFDIIFSNATLHWVKNHKPVLSGINDALKNKGKFLLQMGGKGNAADMLNVVEKVTAEKKWCDYFTRFKFPYKFYDKDEYSELLKKAGLAAERIELIPMDMVHSGKDKLAGWFRTTWHPFTEKLPADLKPEFIDRVISLYLQQHPPDKDGHTHVNMIRLEVEGYKF